MEIFRAILALVWRAIVTYDGTAFPMQAAAWVLLTVAGLLLVPIITYRMRKSYKTKHHDNPEIMYHKLARFFGALALACLFLIGELTIQQAKLDYGDEYMTYDWAVGTLLIIGTVLSACWVLARFMAFMETRGLQMCENFGLNIKIWRHKAQIEIELKLLLWRERRSHHIK